MEGGQCYVCYDEETQDNPFAVNPCDCKGSIKLHQTCLTTIQIGKSNCGVCNVPWNKPKKYRNGMEIIESLRDNSISVYTVNNNDVIVGIFETLYLNGQISGRLQIVNNEQNGLGQMWHDNGKLKMEGYYMNGKLEGLYQCWYSDGVYHAEENYRNGLKEGLCKYWYKNGKLHSEENYINGKKHGVSKIWYADGNLYEEANYNNGLKEGICSKMMRRFTSFIQI